MIKAASLAYAIFISLALGILCYALLLLYQFNLQLRDYQKTEADLITLHDSALSYYLSMSSTDISVEDLTVPFEGPFQSSIETKKWGVFDLWRVKTGNRERSIIQHLLLAPKYDKPLPGLYIKNDGSSLKISGETSINGDIYIPRSRMERIKISGQQGFYDPKFSGNKYPSQSLLPGIQEFILEEPEEIEVVTLQDMDEETNFNSFSAPTKIVTVNGVLDRVTLKGNFILRSQTSVVVKSTCNLEDVIIQSPQVIFERGFEGNLQVFASSQITLSENVSLNYPSVLWVQTPENTVGEILVEKNSKVQGSIILNEKTRALNDEESLITIHPQAIVEGEIFTPSRLALYGTLKGSAMVGSLWYNSPSTEYRNLLYNATLDTLKNKELQFQYTPNFVAAPSQQILLKKV